MARVKLMLLRLSKLRNIVALMITLIFLYLLKTIGTYTSLDMIPIRFPQQRVIEQGMDYFLPVNMEKIDWHNYEQILRDKKLTGVGEQGKAAQLPKSEKKVEEELYAVNGFNGALSDKIALNRSLPDIRHPKCREKKYIASLPTVSVVVPFHNEHWSTLLRTAVSVLNRSPKHLIKEILLVDDASTKDFLKEKLDNYLLKNYPKVRVIRLPVRSGLITARLAGAKEAIGDVLIFLDSHTEANVNWLPPLLEPIALDHRTVVCPFIDVVAYDTFEYRSQDEGARGAFDWEFFYKRLKVLPSDEKNMPEPFDSPVMAGGLFAISRVFFWELGGYDPGLDIWGGEQYELSFKIWQCGGRMVDAPCSRIGHIYRKFAPFPNPRVGSDFVGKNYRRVAEVWMDEYAEYLYRRRPHYRNIDPGDISKQKALRQKLQCKPFKWFMTHVAFDLTFHYPFDEPEPYASGKIISEQHPLLCIDAQQGSQGDALQIKSCSSNDQKEEQQFVFSWHKDIKSKTRNMCWDLPDSAPMSPITLYQCHLGGGNQFWKYDLNTKQIKQGANEQVCLEIDKTLKNRVYINNCDSTAKKQRWIVENINEVQMTHWGDKRKRPIGPPPPGKTDPITE